MKVRDLIPTPSARTGARPDCLAIAVALAFALPFSAVQAQATANTAAPLEIPAQSLNRALLQLGQQADIQIYFLPETVAGIEAPAISGTLTAQDALARLLRNTGIHAQWNGRTVALSRPTTGSATQLAPVLVQATVTPTTENSDSYTAQAVTVGKTAQSLRDVPRSVSVLTRAQLDDQRMASFNEAVEQLPGLTLRPADGWGSGGYYARGHKISSIMVDGSPAKGVTEGDFSFNTSMAKYDSVQFLHGPDGLFSGNGQPSGTINLVRKRPLDRFQFKTTLSAGSWQNYLGEVDLSAPLAADGSVRGRVVAAYNDTHKFYDYAHRKDGTLYGILSADLTDRTTLAVGFSHDTKRGQGQDYATAFPRYIDGSLMPLPRSLGLPAFSYMNSESDNYFAELEHAFNHDWRLRVNASGTRTTNDIFLPYYNGAVDPTTGAGSHFFRWMETYDGKVDARALDANLSGSFEALSRRHRVVVGADYLRTHNTGAISVVNGLGGTPIDWATFDPGSYTEFTAAAPASFRNNLSVQKGVYGYGDFQLVGPLRLVAGGRYASFDNTDARYRTTAVSTPAISRNHGYFLPYYALVYDVSDAWTVYATNARSYEDQSHRYGTDHRPLDPTEGRSIELGIKGELWDGRLNTNLTIYRTDRTNYAVKVADDPAFDSFGGSCCYAGDGRFRAQGVEMQVSGELLPNWQVNAGYTFDDNTTAYGSDSGQRYDTQTPKHTLRLWTSYRLQGKLAGLRVGGGLRMQSSYFSEGSVRAWNPSGGADGQGAFDGASLPYRFTDPGRATWNAFVAYAFNRNWTAALNINNVFDKRYLQGVGTTSGGNVYGEPRNILVTVRGTF